MPMQPNAVPCSQIDCPPIRSSELLARYDFFLLDAYGVLVNAEGACPGAAGFLRDVRGAGKGFRVVTNDASRLASTAAQFYRGHGLDIADDEVITSGQLLAPYFAAEGLAGARCMVLGPPDSFIYVERAGGEAIAPDPHTEVDAVVVCDDAGYPFLETMDGLLSNLCRHIDRGREVRLILPNPDVIYPAGDGGFGYTSGGAALLLEAALGQRYPELAPTFARLGKPYPPMYQEALRACPGKRAVMVGDQLETDIAGARGQGLDAVLADTGVTNWERARVAPDLAPTYRLPRFG